MALTKKQKKSYLREYGHCPYCKSSNIEGAQYDYNGNQIYQDIYCLTCNKVWTDIYTLTDVEDKEVG